MELNARQRYLILVGKLVVEEGMCADEAEEMAAAITRAVKGIAEQEKFEADVRRTIEAL